MKNATTFSNAGYFRRHLDSTGALLSLTLNFSLFLKPNLLDRPEKVSTFLVFEPSPSVLLASPSYHTLVGSSKLA